MESMYTRSVSGLSGPKDLDGFSPRVISKDQEASHSHHALLYPCLWPTAATLRSSCMYAENPRQLNLPAFLTICNAVALCPHCIAVTAECSLCNDLDVFFQYMSEMLLQIDSPMCIRWKASGSGYGYVAMCSSFRIMFWPELALYAIARLLLTKQCSEWNTSSLNSR